MLNRYLRQFTQSPDGLYHADDLNFALIDTVSSPAMPKPVSLPSSATIAPTTFVTVVTGTVPVTTITPPVNGWHLLSFIFTDASPGVTGTTGNIAIASTVVSKKALLMTYEPVAAKYYPSY